MQPEKLYSLNQHVNSKLNILNYHTQEPLNMTFNFGFKALTEVFPDYLAECYSSFPSGICYRNSPVYISSVKSSLITA